MLYIILTQKNRKTEEILYDHGAENSDNSQSSIHFRRNEKIMWHFMKVAYACMILYEIA